MRGDIIPDSDHVCRLCGGSHVREDGTISATAFKPRPAESFVSVNWLEYFSLSDRASEIVEVRRALAAKRRIGGTARLAVLNVGEARSAVLGYSQDQSTVAVRHEPELEPGRPQDPSHSGIHGVPEDDNTVPELLARAVREAYAAR